MRVQSAGLCVFCESALPALLTPVGRAAESPGRSRRGPGHPAAARYLSAAARPASGGPGEG